MRKKKRQYRKKMKLQKGAVYSLFAVIFFALAGVSIFSFTKSGELFISVSQYLDQYFGPLKFLAPILFLLLGFFFLRMKFFLSKLHIVLGFLILFLSLTGLVKAGIVGSTLSITLSEIIGSLGTKLVYSAGVAVGLIVFFDTSLDQLIEWISALFTNLPRFFPSKLFKTKRFNSKDKQITILELGIRNSNQKQPLFADKSLEEKESQIKKDQALMSHKLV